MTGHRSKLRIIVGSGDLDSSLMGERMLDPEQTNDRLLLLRRLCELSAERIDQEIADQQRAWKLLLEEENRATMERLATCRSGSE